MVQITTSTTLGELAVGCPSLISELERRGFDYCCNGSRSLAEACEQHGLDPLAVASDLSKAARDEAAEAWSDMNLLDLVDHVESVHHRYLAAELPRALALVDAITEEHSQNHPELFEVQRLTHEVQADLRPHLVKEERVLFPMVRRLASAKVAPSFHCGTPQNPISMMLSEHGRVGELLADLRDAANGYEIPRDACATYRACYGLLAEIEADTRLHLHKENNVLFPAVVALEARLAQERRGATR
jgi:regulator of cell morphogenesis and NO signaling